MAHLSLCYCDLPRKVVGPGKPVSIAANGWVPCLNGSIVWQHFLKAADFTDRSDSVKGF